MSRSQKWRQEWSFFIGDSGRRKYNRFCVRCAHSCKQSFRADLIACPHFSRKAYTLHYSVIIGNVYGVCCPVNISTEHIEFSRLRKTESVTL